MENTKSYYQERFDDIKKELPTMSGEDLIDELLFAHKEYEEFCRRDDAIEWSEENESLATEIYFTIRRETLNRLESNEG